MMKTYNNMKILDVDTSQGHFTRHGLHMNGMGKEKMARKISEVVKKMVTRKEETPITLVWKDKSVGKSGGTEEESDISEKKEIEVRASGRKCKQPVARRRFFMDIKLYEGSVKKTKTFNGNIHQCQIVSVLH
jgi:hypothetical protein